MDNFKKYLPFAIGKAKHEPKQKIISCSDDDALEKIRGKGNCDGYVNSGYQKRKFEVS